MRVTTKKRVAMLATMGAVAVTLGPAASASAATISVTSTADPAGTATQCTLRP